MIIEIFFETENFSLLPEESGVEDIVEVERKSEMSFIADRTARVKMKAYVSGFASIYINGSRNPYPPKTEPELHAEYEKGRADAIKKRDEKK